MQRRFGDLTKKDSMINDVERFSQVNAPHPRPQRRLPRVETSRNLSGQRKERGHRRVLGAIRVLRWLRKK